MEPNELDKPGFAAGSAAGQHAQHGRSHAGVLVHHGEGRPSEFQQNTSSYFVTLQTPSGQQQIWGGSDLQRAMQDSQMERGQAVLLQAGAEGQGNDNWSVHAIDKAQLQAYHGSAGTSPATPAQPGSAGNAAPGSALGIDQQALDAIMQVVGQVKQHGNSLDPEEVRRINATLDDSAKAAGPQATHSSPKSGAEALVRGGAELIGGAAALTGAAMQGLGRGAGALADSLRGSPTTRDAGAAASAEPAVVEESEGRVQVLPRLSEYRVDQVEKAANNYEKAHVAFWNADNMPEVRQQIEARAEATGLSLPDVIEKMKPDGEFTDLHERFVEAVGQSPEAQSNKKAMDKALTGWSRQYGRAQEELLNPETEGNPHYEKLKNRLESSSDSMHRNTASTPAFAGEGQSHLERLSESMQRLAERLKEMVTGFVNFVRGKSSGSDDFTP